jgi:hypothetical protein
MFGTPYFRPMGIGGWIDNRWILAGWGLEYFVGSFAGMRELRKNASITAIQGDDVSAIRKSHDEYVRQLAKCIRSGGCPNYLMCEYETVWDEVLCTFLQTDSLDTAILKELEAKVQVCRRWSFYTYGTFSVVSSYENSLCWENAFRFVVKNESGDNVQAIPFVVMRVGSDVSCSATVSISSSSTIWLRVESSLNGHIAEHDADENVDRLAHIVRCFCKNAAEQIVSAELLLSGTPFRVERARLSRAFGNDIGEVIEA